MLSDSEPFRPTAWALIVVGSAGLGLALRLTRRPQTSFHVTERRSKYPPGDYSVQLKLRSALLVFSVMFCAGASYLAVTNVHSPWSDRLWGLSLISILLCSLPEFRRVRLMGMKTAVTVLAFLLLGLWLRTLDLSDFPYFVHGDEGEHASNAEAFIEGRRHVWQSGWYGFPGFGFILQGAVLKLFGFSIFGIRFASAVIGTISLICIYFLGRVSFGNRVGLYAMGLGTWFHLHLFFSRYGLTNIQVALFAAAAAALWLLALREGSFWISLLCGVTIGLGTQSYLGFHALLPVILGATVLFPLIRLRESRRKWAVFPGLVLGTLLGLGPFLVHWLSRPEIVYGRTQQVTVLSEQAMERHQKKLNLNTATEVVGLQAVFNLLAPICKDSTLWYGKRVRMLSPILTSLYVFGFFAFIYFALSRLLSRQWDYWSISTFAFPILTILTVSFAAALSMDAPAWQRLVLIIPFVLIVVAKGLDWVTNAVAVLPGGRFLGAAFLGAVLVWSALFNTNAYFGSDALGSQRARPQAHLIREVEKLPASTSLYLFGCLPRSQCTFANHGGIRLARLGTNGVDLRQVGESLPSELQEKLDPDTDAAFVFWGRDEEKVWPILESAFPNGVLSTTSLPDKRTVLLTYSAKQDAVAGYLDLSTRKTPSNR